MRRTFLPVALSLALLSAMQGAPSPSATKNAPPAPAKDSTKAAIDSLSAEDLEKVIPLLKTNFINPNVLTDLDLKRATVEGLIARLGRGVMVLPNGQTPGATNAPFYSEMLEGKIGYLRPGTLDDESLKKADASLKSFTAQKMDALILDLRASGSSNDFEAAAGFAQRFAEKGDVLFILRKPSANQEKAFRSTTPPSYQGLLIVLVDGETAGPAEALAAFLQTQRKAMVLGEPSAGRAYEYADLPLPSGKTTLRVAVSEVLGPDKQPVYPKGIVPDVAVEMPAADKQKIFAESSQHGMAGFVFQNERPHLNEAALLAGTNPELDAAQARQAGRKVGPRGLYDLVMQRAVDLVTSLTFLQNR